MKKLAIVTTHPIQYNAPWFKLLNEASVLQIMVFYTWGNQAATQKFDPGFGKEIAWDLPLLEGYLYSFVQNIADEPGSHHRKGIINPSLIQDIEQWGADAVLVFGWNFVSHEAVMRYFHGKIPVLFRGDSTLLDEKNGLKKILRRLYLKLVYRFVDVALYTGTHNKQYFLAHGLREAQLVYAPHAIDNNRFAEPDDFYQKQAALLRAQLGFTPQDIVLLFAGKLESKKNPFYLLEVLLYNKHPSIKLLFVGNGLLENDLKRAASSDKRIVFVDFQNQQQMPIWYRVADILTLPSIGPGETWGLALNEAMACGKAVAASKVTGGAIDLIKEDLSGVIFNPKDIHALDQLLQRSILNKEYLINMGIESKKIIQSFDFEKITNAISQTVQQLTYN